MCWNRRVSSANASKSCCWARPIKVARSIPLLLPRGAGSRSGPLPRAEVVRGVLVATRAGMVGGRMALPVEEGPVGPEGEEQLDELHLPIERGLHQGREAPALALTG